MSIADDIEASDQYHEYSELGHEDKIHAVICQHTCSNLCTAGVEVSSTGGYIQECPWCGSSNITGRNGNGIRGRLGINRMTYECGTIIHVCLIASGYRLTAYTRTLQCKLLIVGTSKDNVI